MEHIEDLLLAFLEKSDVEDSLEFSKQNGVSHEDVVSVLKSLIAAEYVESKAIDHESWKLTDSGAAAVKNGAPEALVFNAVPQEGILLEKLNADLGEVAKLGMAQAVPLKWVRIDKAGGKPTVFRVATEIEDTLQKQLQSLQDANGKPVLAQAILDGLKKRKMIVAAPYKTYKVTKGAKYAPKRIRPATDLTQEMIISGSWKQQQFKTYNFQALGLPPNGGALHPLLKVRKEYREIFLEMGFEEMPTNNFVESSFWNFDTLFVPQMHPARDMQDTFFISDPADASEIPADYMEKVKKVHETGDADSIGYRYKWKESETRKNTLRTHTTAVSARMLYALAQQPTFTPKKYFSIDRVFRNEALDATHLAEFHQIEGLIADHNLTLADLIGSLNQFFQKLGLKKLRFKPTYNPYTEPSMEVFSYHEGMQRWVEVGNSGVFRPEMLRPMGLPEDVSVIAWGLSLERPTMIKYGITNIRDLIGHKVDIGMIRENSMCRLDKD
eukprot:TRINITY_DN1832_c0_g1_i1.p1 TRINITY_DN1832_c0_g1~~TRINITY_DN1832_c0_g1_i1.p1  ORF type:complete len:497 (+),score=133.44 TRINITY_DN1832_c0_g1_i1:49-1539(+)